MVLDFQEFEFLSVFILRSYPEGHGDHMLPGILRDKKRIKQGQHLSSLHYLCNIGISHEGSRMEGLEYNAK